MLEEVLNKFNSEKELDPETAEHFFDELRACPNEELLLGILSAWNTKGVTANELFLLATILRERALSVETKRENLVDIVGTGGSTAKLFNISTATAFVVAGAGIPVAKHGNKAATSKTGSADALSLLGVNIASDPSSAGAILDQVGICFMFAPLFHSLSAEIAAARRTLGKPTVFNQLGPIANPAGAEFQLIGVWDAEVGMNMAKAVNELGTKKTWIVHGRDGLDEISLRGTTDVIEITENGIDNFEISASAFGLAENPLDDYRNLSAKESAEVIKTSLNGKENPATDIILLNSAAAITVAGVADDMKEALDIARDSVFTGKAFRKLGELVEATRS